MFARVGKEKTRDLELPREFRLAVSRTISERKAKGTHTSRERETKHTVDPLYQTRAVSPSIPL